MCGLAGFVYLESPKFAPQESEQILGKMLSQVAERGPDGQNIWHDESAYFGHSRLSIIDLSELSSQPMRLQNDEFVLVYNGEIYNYKELKERLIRLGISFNSVGDTEVLLQGLRHFGIDWLKELNGMFAGAVWHKPSKRLTIFRDRFGIKPLYWATVGNTVLFSSLIKSFLQHPLFKANLNLSWLNEYLTFQNVHGDTTPFEGVHLLEPGQCLVFRAGDSSPVSHDWAPQRQYTPNKRLSSNDAVEEITRLFSKAVSNSLVSDVPVGAYLSGGIDSSAVVSIASRFNSSLHTFTCGVDESKLSDEVKSINELAQARSLAAQLGCNFHEVIIKPEDIPFLHRSVLRKIEEPRVGVIYQNDLAAQLASNWVKVCLSGAGGDELFGGYPWRYATVRYAQRRNEFLKRYYGFWQRVFNDASKCDLFTDEVRSQLSFSAPFQRFSSYFPEEGNFADIGFRTWLCLNYESKFFLHGLLQVGDRLAGSYGLEERFPFLDNDLVAFVDTIPGHLHWDTEESPRNGVYYSGKRLLRQALAKFVPEEIATRAKQGFVIPDGAWFNDQLRGFVANELSGNDSLIKEYLNPKVVGSVIAGDTMASYSVNSAQLWSLLSVEGMLKSFFSSSLRNDQSESFVNSLDQLKVV